MLVKTTVTEKKEVTKEVKLPYCAKRDNNTFFRVNEDESVLVVTAFDNWANVDFTNKYGVCYQGTLERALSCDPCSEAEVMQAIKKATQLVDNSIQAIPA